MLQMSSGKMYYAQKAASNTRVYVCLFSEFVTDISDIADEAWMLRSKKGPVGKI